MSQPDAEAIAAWQYRDAYAPVKPFVAPIAFRKLGWSLHRERMGDDDSTHFDSA